MRDNRAMSAVISPCSLYRYRLDREVQLAGVVIAYFGVNPSTASAEVEDQTTRKWRGFTLRNGGRRYIAANPFAFRATDVAQLARRPDPVGPENARYLLEVIDEADVLVPCWGARGKVPRSLHSHLDALAALLLASGKPVRVLGLTASGDPLQTVDAGLRDAAGRLEAAVNESRTLSCCWPNSAPVRFR